MSQLRLFATGSEAEIADLFDRMSGLFEDDGYALSTRERDEARDIWEISIYFAEEDEETVRKRLDPLGAEFEREVLPEIDWVAKSLEGLSPVRAGRFLVHGSHDRERVRPCDVAIEIEAGQAFGTGHHGTTAGCLEMIEAEHKRRRFVRALDLGTGSGVLAIAIRKLQPMRVLATDIDPIATRVAKRNLRDNAVIHDVRVETAAGFHAPCFAEEGPFDLVVANILARPLMRMAPAIRNHLAPHGSVVLSGILASQRWKVLAAFNAQGFAHRRTLWRGEWVTLLLQ
ncbi:50S ribosomal protein L11 methyltransferase [Pararhizobium mangrovi]|uniref:Ribosomal protein L11 methyltransferase n=1 Tax=Pararhizobium mangrovi TaxID=2590452 RepID=A0A506U7U9_9HYPH|nr:50S ribosomal protein L11 methyltransferase [Pararhizobium mangrovi]TPW29558.1 50S ribosomal protein L11 methyltransferase [Pararhizobium mangrovi]